MSSKTMKRAAAFIIDLVLLNLIGRFLSISFSQTFVSMDCFGFLVGLFIFCSYFALCESWIGNASLGKRLLGLRVVEWSSSRLKLGKSLVRSLIILSPWMLAAHVFYPDDSGRMMVGSVINILVFCALSASVVFPLINKTWVFQDLITNTYVSMGSEPPVSKESKASVFKYCRNFEVFLVCVTGLILLSQKVGANANSCSDYKLDRKSFQSGTIDSRHRSVSCYLSSGRYHSPFTVVEITYTAFEPSAVSMENIMKAAQDLRAAGVSLHDHDRLILRIKHGFDIGIYSSWATSEKEFSAEEFNSNLSKL